MNLTLPAWHLKIQRLVTILIKALIVNVLVIYHALSDNTNIATEAAAALRLAKMDVAGRHSTKMQFHSLAFEQEISDSEGNRTVSRYDPSKPEEQHWEVISVTGEQLPGLGIPTPKVLSLEILEKLSLKYYEQEHEYWVFKGDMDLYSSDQHSSRYDKGDAFADDLDQHLVVFIRINKTTNRVRNLQFTNLSDFKPDALATIERFVINIWFEPVGSEGPLMATFTELAISGRYGWFISFEESVTQSLSAFRFVN